MTLVGVLPNLTYKVRLSPYAIRRILPLQGRLAHKGTAVAAVAAVADVAVSTALVTGHLAEKVMCELRHAAYINLKNYM